MTRSLTRTLRISHLSSKVCLLQSVFLKNPCRWKPSLSHDPLLWMAPSSPVKILSGLSSWVGSVQFQLSTCWRLLSRESKRSVRGRLGGGGSCSPRSTRRCGASIFERSSCWLAERLRSRVRDGSDGKIGGLLKKKEKRRVNYEAVMTLQCSN